MKATLPPAHSRAVRAVPSGSRRSSGRAIRESEQVGRAVAYLLLATAVAVAPILSVAGPTPAAAALGFPAVLLAPGAALTGFFTFDHLGDEVLLDIVVSLAVALVGTQVMLGIGFWQPTAFAAAIAVVTVGPLLRHAVDATSAQDPPRSTPSATGHDEP